MGLEKTIFDYDVPSSELCRLEIRSTGEYIKESNQIVKLYQLHKLNKLYRDKRGVENTRNKILNIHLFRREPK